ncbi:MAG TPA: DsbA family protein [Edaphocola sp.]|nr:DsbA family protein [Edaphocola sp.]
MNSNNDKKNLIYCYDTYCGWCYGFRPVMEKIATVFSGQLNFEVLSGGMVLPGQPQPISVTAPFIQKAYKTVEQQTGVRFGNDFLWHIFHAGESDWFPDSLKPAIALCILKEKTPEKALAFASDLQYALNFEGRDLTDDEAYRHLLPKYNLDETAFYTKLHEPAYEDKARYDFSLVKQLKVSGFPTVFIQATDQKFYLAARGYTDYQTLKTRIDNILEQL